MVSSEYRELYQDQYHAESEREWRRLGAIGKAANIKRAWYDIHGPRKPRVVEIGCGDGAVAERLAELEFFESYEGFDLSASGITQARSRGIEGATFQLIDGDHIPVADEHDLVVMTHVVEHLEHPRRLLQEARRIAPELIVEVPTELNQRIPKDYDWRPVGHINKYNSLLIRQLVQTCGFEVQVQFTTNPSLQVALYADGSRRSQANWAIKEYLLRYLPSLAKTSFTYHETLLARRSESKHRPS